MTMNAFEKYAAKKKLMASLTERLYGSPAGPIIGKASKFKEKVLGKNVEAVKKGYGSTKADLDSAEAATRKARLQLAGGTAAAAAVIPTALLLRALAKRSKTPVATSAKDKIVSLLKKHPKKSMAAGAGLTAGGLAGLAAANK